MSIVVFSDRDGTINKDENYYLGSAYNWKDQVSFLDGVVKGIKLLNDIPDSYIFIITNQSGVALKGGLFDNLTEDRMHEVNTYIIRTLETQGAKVNGYFACPFVDSNYVKKAEEKKREIDLEFVCDNHIDLKPNIGMIQKALDSVNLKKEDCELFMIGDRLSDVQMGLNAGGTGILIESYKTKELGDIQKVSVLEGKTYVAKNFLDAANYIKKQIKK